MSERGRPHVGAFGAALDDFVRAMTEVARRGESPLAARLREHDEQRSVTARFHQLAGVDRDAVVLPDGRIARLERHAIGIARHSERLRATGRHLKRGVLLHGLLGAMPGRTTVLLTGRGLGLIEQALAIARDLAPATVVFEDVDLVTWSPRSGRCRSATTASSSSCSTRLRARRGRGSPVPPHDEPSRHPRAGARRAARSHRPRPRGPLARCGGAPQAA